VTWIGGGWLQAIGMPGGDIHLSDGETTDEIRGWCQKQGVQLFADNPFDV
jgi:hypothetical protein